MDSRLERNLDTTELVRSIRHAVVLPVNSLMNLTQIILSEVDGAINDDIRQDVTDIAADVTRLQAVCMNLVDLCRFDSTPIVCEPLDLLEPMRAALNEASQHAREVGKTLLRETGTALPPVRANADYVHELLLRLVTYVFRLSDQAVIRADAETEAVVIRVGSGDKLPEVVPDGFNALPAAWLEDEFAVELLICKRLAEMQGGTFWATCPPENGPMLCFSLPFDG